MRRKYQLIAACLAGLTLLGTTLTGALAAGGINPWAAHSQSTVPDPTSTFVVTTNLDTDGTCSPAVPCSLRQAINSANAAQGSSVIQFAIPGPGVHTILINSWLPATNKPITIDGYTQTGSAKNTLASGSNAVLQIEIRGGPLFKGSALTISGGNSALRGLAINSFSSNAIVLQTVDGDVVDGNFIGTDPTGMRGQGNVVGITIQFTKNNIIGGSTPDKKNVISSNMDSTGYIGIGVYIVGPGADSNTVLGNLIGTDKTGTQSLPNAEGIQILNANTNTIGGTAGITPAGACSGACNVISGNGVVYDGPSNGIDLNNASGNLIIGNFVGIDATGNSPLHNDADGFFINHGSSNNTIGGTSGAERNVISGNAVEGIEFCGTNRASVCGADPSNNKIYGNYIGTNSNGFGKVGNAHNGIFIGAGTLNLIGGSLPGQGNVISGNSDMGIQIITSGGFNQTQILGNKIGVTAGGSAGGIGNASHGIYLESSGNVIGGTAPGAGNIIAFNGVSVQVAVGVNVGSGVANSIRANSIHDHPALGIDLQNDYITYNHAQCAASGANNLLNYPVLTFADGSTTIIGSMNCLPQSSYDLDFFVNGACDSAGFGEGQTYLGSKTVQTDGGGNANFTVQFSAATPGQWITATATDGRGNTSEFSKCIAVAAPAATPTLIPTATTVPTRAPIGARLDLPIVVFGKSP